VAVAAGVLFVFAVLFAPQHGYLARLFRQFSLSLRIAREDALLLLYRRHEKRPGESYATGELIAALGGWLLPRCALIRLQWSGAVKSVDGGFRLTEVSLGKAKELLRGHRLWESYLADQLGVPADHVHEPAHRVEHFINPDMQKELAAKTGQPGKDPHDRPIPPGGDRMTGMP